MVASLPPTTRLLHVGGSGSNAYTRMSGTSMAAGVVSGGVALLAEVVPGLTFAHAKLLLQSTASLMPNEGLAASGAGSVDFWTARRLAGSSLDLDASDQVSLADFLRRPELFPSGTSHDASSPRR